VPPLSANVTNTIGLVPGSVGGAFGYRSTFSDQGRRVARLAVPALIGAAGGTTLLLLTPDDTFEVIVPVLVAGSCLLLLFQPRIARVIPHAGNEHSPLLFGGLVMAGAYAGYFGSAVGILLLALLTLFVADTVQRLNAVKIVLAGLSNTLAAVAFAFLAPVRWEYAAVLMVSSLAGGQGGALLAQRVSGDVLRVAIACAGLVVAVVLAVRAF
jgi:uncharacterized membrane protein YfcA